VSRTQDWSAVAHSDPVHAFENLCALFSALIQILQREGMTPTVDDNTEVKPPPVGPPTHDYERGDMKQAELASFIA
jgi:hypothetical protein